MQFSRIQYYDSTLTEQILIKLEWTILRQIVELLIESYKHSRHPTFLAKNEKSLLRLDGIEKTRVICVSDTVLC
jgi:hypothetical protein